MTGQMTFGAVTIERIVEYEAPLMPMLDLFPRLAPDALARHTPFLQSLGAIDEAGMAVLCVQCFLVRTPDRTILVDAGIGNGKTIGFMPAWSNKADTRFTDGLAACGVAPEAVDTVLCTHLHSDHVGWNTRRDGARWVPTFPNATYLFGRAEYEFWREADAAEANPVFRESVRPVVDAGRVEFVEAGQVVAGELTLLATPGHTPGHFSVLLGGGEAVITADVTHSPLQARMPALSPVFDIDPEAAARTRQDLFGRLADTGAVLWPTHYGSRSAFRLERDGDAFTCVAA